MPDTLTKNDIRKAEVLRCAALYGMHFNYSEDYDKIICYCACDKMNPNVQPVSFVVPAGKFSTVDYLDSIKKIKQVYNLQVDAFVKNPDAEIQKFNLSVFNTPRSEWTDRLGWTEKKDDYMYAQNLWDATGVSKLPGYNRFIENKFKNTIDFLGRHSATWGQDIGHELKEYNDFLHKNVFVNKNIAPTQPEKGE